MVTDKWQRVLGVERRQRVPHPRRRYLQGPQGCPTGAPHRVGSQQLDVPRVHSTIVSRWRAERGKAAVHMLSALCPGSELGPGTASLAPSQDFSLCLCCRLGYEGRRSQPRQQRQLVLGARPARLPGPPPHPALCVHGHIPQLQHALGRHVITRFLGLSHHPTWDWEHPKVQPRPGPQGRMNTCTRAAGVGVAQRGHTAKGNGALPEGLSLILRCCF